MGADPGQRNGIIVDDTAFPVVLMRFVGAPDKEAFAGFFAHASALLDRTRAFVLIIDARDGAALPFERVREAGAWLKAEAARREAYIKGTAFVLPGPVQRAVLSAVVRLAPVGAHEVFGDVPSAARWALDVLGRPIPLGD